MTDAASWLPPIRPLSGEWQPYCDALFESFERDLSVARFHGLRVGRRKAPIVQGKPDGFWHVTSETWEKDSDERIPDMRRCERVPWIAAMIMAAGTDHVRCWEQPARAGQRNGPSIMIALPDFSHVVILRERQGSNGPWMMLVTAYPASPGRQRRFAREYAAAGEYVPK